MGGHWWLKKVNALFCVGSEGGQKNFGEKMGEFGVSGVWRVDWIGWLGFRNIGREFGRGVDWLRVRYRI